MFLLPSACVCRVMEMSHEENCLSGREYQL